MQEAFFDVPLYREFARLGEFSRLLDESTILRFRHRLEKHKLADGIVATVNDVLSRQGLLLKEGSAVDATLIAAPSSTKNKDGKRDPEMHSSKKGNQWYFGMKAHIGVDADSGLVHTVRATAGHMADVTEGNALLRGEETVVFADAGYQGADKRLDAKSRHQASVRVCESALQRAEEKHAAAQDAVCAIQFMDGQVPLDGGAGMSVSESRETALNRAKMLQCPLKYGPEKPELKAGSLI